MVKDVILRRWQRGKYFISTQRSLIDLNAVNTAFGTDEVFWTAPQPEDILQLTIEHSLCFALYLTESEGRVSDIS
jgi:hypothetical protein